MTDNHTESSSEYQKRKNEWEERKKDWDDLCASVVDFVRASPDFPGGDEMARKMGTLIGKMDYHIRKI